MKLDKASRYIQDNFETVDFEVKELSDEKLVMSASGLNAKDYFEDDVYCRIVAYQSGTLHVFFTFDTLELDKYTGKLLNNFNDNVPFFRASITDIEGVGYLQLHAANIGCSSEQDLADAVSFFFEELISESTIEYLTALTDLTE